MAQAAASIPARAYIVVLVGIAAVSLAAIFIRLAQAEGVPSLLIAAGRLTLATLFLTPFAWHRHASDMRALERGDLALAGVSGLFLALHFATWILSLEYTSVLIGVVLVTTGPLWIALLERFFLGAGLARLVVAGLLLGIVGGLIIGASGSNDLTPEGALLAVSGAVAFAVYIVIGRKLRTQLALLPYIWLVYGCAALILIAAVLITRTSVTGYSAQGYTWVGLLALVPQLVGHTSFNYAVRYFPATFIGIAGQLEPVASAAIAVLLFGEIPGALQIVGSIVVLTGVALAGLAQARRTS